MAGSTKTITNQYTKSWATYIEIKVLFKVIISLQFLLHLSICVGELFFKGIKRKHPSMYIRGYRIFYTLRYQGIVKSTVSGAFEDS